MVFSVVNAPESDRTDMLSELELMKKLKPHPHVIKLMGCVTETGKGTLDNLREITLIAMIRLSALLATSAPSPNGRSPLSAVFVSGSKFPIAKMTFIIALYIQMCVFLVFS